MQDERENGMVFLHGEKNEAIGKILGKLAPSPQAGHAS